MSEGPLNLTAPRSEKSVWDTPTLKRRLTEYNQDRWIAAAGGTALAAAGARRGGVGGTLLAAAGAAIAVRAAMGRNDLGRARHWVNLRLREFGWNLQDVVQDSSEESFPASDAPGWTTAAATTKR